MESSFDSEQAEQEFYLSWTAYVRPVLIFLVFNWVGAAIFVSSKIQATKYVGIGICVLSIAWSIYRIMMLRSVRLYTDDSGVWVHRGVFPWSKGITGVMWRDIDDAVYFTGFFSWLLRSYKIRVGHRFTKTSEIFISHVARGNLAVEHINSLVREIVSRGGNG